MRCYNNNKENERHQHRGRCHQISRRKREMLRQHSTGENANAKAQIPSGEIGGSGRAPLGIGAKVDKQGIERRKSRPKTQTTAQGNQEKRSSRIVGAQSVAMVAHTQAEHSQHDNAQTQSDGLRHLAPIDHLACKQARGNQADGIHGEKQSTADGQTHLFGIEGDIVGNLPVGESQKRERNTRQQTFQQNETVQGNRGALDGRAHPMLDLGGEKDRQQTASHTAQKDGIETEMLIHKQSRHRADRHCDIVGHTVITDALSPML